MNFVIKKYFTIEFKKIFLQENYFLDLIRILLSFMIKMLKNRNNLCFKSHNNFIEFFYQIKNFNFFLNFIVLNHTIILFF